MEYSQALDQALAPALQVTSIAHIAAPSDSILAYTVPYPIRIAPLEQGPDTQTEAEAGAGAEAEENHPTIPEDSIYVEVKVEVRDTGDLFHFEYDGIHYTSEYSDWQNGTVIVDDKSYECFLYTGKKTGKHFWTYSLRDLEQLETETRWGKGKGKGKKGKQSS